eukprot:6209470-Amphidinium_carterae.2
MGGKNEHFPDCTFDTEIKKAILLKRVPAELATFLGVTVVSESSIYEELRDRVEGYLRRRRLCHCGTKETQQHHHRSSSHGCGTVGSTLNREHSHISDSPQRYPQDRKAMQCSTYKGNEDCGTCPGEVNKNRWSQQLHLQIQQVMRQRFHDWVCLWRSCDTLLDSRTRPRKMIERQQMGKRSGSASRRPSWCNF